MTRVIVGDLGWCVCRLVVDAHGQAESLHIISAADTDEHRHAPSESVGLYGRANIMRLKAFLEQNLLADEVSP